MREKNSNLENIFLPEGPFIEMTYHVLRKIQPTNLSMDILTLTSDKSECRKTLPADDPLKTISAFHSTSIQRQKNELVTPRRILLHAAKVLELG
jgi:hypothetical protein